MNFFKTLLSVKPTDDETVITLSKVQLFDNLSLHDLEELSLEINEINFDKDSVVFSENDESDGMYIIKSGGVNILKKNDAGKEFIITTLGDLNYFGEMSLIDNIRRTATVRTIIPTTAYFLSKHHFNIMLKKNKTTTIKILFNLSRTLSRRLELTTKNYIFK
ncbi:cyclic nucleotide-binding domain-containing protein [Candidatus Dependentiae bacterium]|nr:cyclic nucleotide-binding domain-containing protein [Candidatus Dependentiae bacterium]